MENFFFCSFRIFFSLSFGKCHHCLLSFLLCFAALGSNGSMDVILLKFHEASDWWSAAWEQRDRRVDGWLFMDSPWPTLGLCLTYVFLVKVAGPRFMRDREPYNVRNFLIVYNFCQVIFSLYIFTEVRSSGFFFKSDYEYSNNIIPFFLNLQLLQSGWGGDYSLRCQPVDYSNNPKALRMLNCCWLYFLSKFTEFFDTVSF